MRAHLFALVVSAVLLASSGCRDRKSAELGASASASASASSKRGPLDGVDEENARALCALAALPTPPEHDSNHDWDTAVIVAKSTDRRFAWVKMRGVARELKADDVNAYLGDVDVGRANADTAFPVCGRFRTDPERKVLVTVTFRTRGDARKGDYLTYVALGMGHDNPRGTLSALKNVSEHEAKLDVLRRAREMIGAKDLVLRDGTLDDWKKALDEGT